MESYPALRIYLQISKFIMKNVTSNIALIAFFLFAIYSISERLHVPPKNLAFATDQNQVCLS